MPFVWKTANNRAIFRAVRAEYKKHKAYGIFASQKKQAITALSQEKWEQKASAVFMPKKALQCIQI